MALPKSSDFVVVGGGIIGINIAWELKKRHPDCSVLVLEKETEVSQHASGRNSGVLHAGFYYHADSLKAKLTAQGNRFLHDYCDEKGLRINKCGKVVVARNESELAGLDELKRRGDVNGVPLEVIDQQQLTELEPLAKTTERALWSPRTAAAGPSEVTMAIRDDAVAAGVQFALGTRCTGVIPGDSEKAGRHTLQVNTGTDSMPHNEFV